MSGHSREYADADLAELAKYWPDLRLLRRSQAPRPWRQQADPTPGEQAERDNLARQERRERTPDTPGYTPAPVRVDLVDLIHQINCGLRTLETHCRKQLNAPPPKQPPTDTLAMVGTRNDTISEWQWNKPGGWTLTTHTKNISYRVTGEHDAIVGRIGWLRSALNGVNEQLAQQIADAARTMLDETRRALDLPEPESVIDAECPVCDMRALRLQPMRERALCRNAECQETWQGNMRLQELAARIGIHIQAEANT